MLVCIVVNVTGSNPVDAVVDCEVVCSDVVSAAVVDGMSVVVSILDDDTVVVCCVCVVVVAIGGAVAVVVSVLDDAVVVCCVCVVVVAIEDVVTQSMFAITASILSYLTFGCVESVEAEK